MSNQDDRSGKLANLLAQMKPQLTAALPKHCSSERIARIALTAIRANYKLGQCTPASFLGSLLQASQLGLEVNTPLGQAYLIPYKDVCTLVVGYQGMLDLARRSGHVRAIYAMPVYQGDEFDYEYGLDPKLHHKPCDRPGPLTHVYAVARLTNGEPIFTVLRRDEVEKYRQRSRAANDGPWVTDYDAMAMKTAIRRIFKWLPKSAEMARAVSVDESLERETTQTDHFSPEVQTALSALPDDTATVETTGQAAPQAIGQPAPPVLQNAPDGRRVKLPGKGGKAAPANDPALGEYGNVELQP